MWIHERSVCPVTIHLGRWRGIEKVKETVKGLVRGTQPDPDTSAERPQPAKQPQQQPERDDDWMPGRIF